MSNSPAPYPADTRAKGWRFELDYEQIEQSSTWALAGSECRPWLLMQWMTAWRQVPCGSLPADEEVIAALIGMSAKAWPKNRKVLMRGWVEADDGRLYHATVTARVLEMLDYRRKNAERVAKFKAAKRDERAGNALPTGEQQDSNDTGTGTGTGTIEIPSSPTVKKKRVREPDAPCPEDVSQQVWTDWVALRKGKGAKVTVTAIEGARAESVKAKLSFNDFLRIWVTRGSQGLSADWIKPHERPAAAPTESAYARQMREKYESIVPAVAAKKPGTVVPFTVEMEAPNGVARLLG
jgi:hypothetical protein